MDFSVTATGPTLADLTARSTRALRTANRQAGRDVAKVGSKAMNAAAKARGWHGRALRVRYKVDSGPSKATATFNPAKGQAGAWAIANTGAGPHLIRPRRAKALRFDARFAAAVHHPGAGGAQVWSKATKAVAKAVKPELEHVYQDALDG